MLKTMTLGQAARWVGISPRMLGLFLTGQLIDAISEIDVDVDGLRAELLESMPGQFVEE